MQRPKDVWLFGVRAGEPQTFSVLLTNPSQTPIDYELTLPNPNGRTYQILRHQRGAVAGGGTRELTVSLRCDGRVRAGKDCLRVVGELYKHNFVVRWTMDERDALDDQPHDTETNTNNNNSATVQAPCPCSMCSCGRVEDAEEEIGQLNELVNALQGRDPAGREVIELMRQRHAAEEEKKNRVILGVLSEKDARIEAAEADAAHHKAMITGIQETLMETKALLEAAEERERERERERENEGGPQSQAVWRSQEGNLFSRVNRLAALEETERRNALIIERYEREARERTARIAALEAQERSLFEWIEQHVAEGGSIGLRSPAKQALGSAVSGADVASSELVAGLRSRVEAQAEQIEHLVAQLTAERVSNGDSSTRKMAEELESLRYARRQAEDQRDRDRAVYEARIAELAAQLEASRLSAEASRAAALAGQDAAHAAELSALKNQAAQLQRELAAAASARAAAPPPVTAGTNTDPGLHAQGTQVSPVRPGALPRTPADAIDAIQRMGSLQSDLTRAKFDAERAHEAETARLNAEIFRLQQENYSLKAAAAMSAPGSTGNSGTNNTTTTTSSSSSNSTTTNTASSNLRMAVGEWERERARWEDETRSLAEEVRRLKLALELAHEETGRARRQLQERAVETGILLDTVQTLQSSEDKDSHLASLAGLLANACILQAASERRVLEITGELSDAHSRALIAEAASEAAKDRAKDLQARVLALRNTEELISGEVHAANQALAASEARALEDRARIRALEHQLTGTQGELAGARELEANLREVHRAQLTREREEHRAERQAAASSMTSSAAPSATSLLLEWEARVAREEVVRQRVALADAAAARASAERRASHAAEALERFRAISESQRSAETESYRRRLQSLTAHVEAANQRVMEAEAAASSERVKSLAAEDRAVDLQRKLVHLEAEHSSRFLLRCRELESELREQDGQLAEALRAYIDGEVSRALCEDDKARAMGDQLAAAKVAETDLLRRLALMQKEADAANREAAKGRAYAGQLEDALHKATRRAREDEDRVASAKTEAAALQKRVTSLEAEVFSIGERVLIERKAAQRFEADCDTLRARVDEIMQERNHTCAALEKEVAKKQEDIERLIRDQQAVPLEPVAEKAPPQPPADHPPQQQQQQQQQQQSAPSSLAPNSAVVALQLARSALEGEVATLKAALVDLQLSVSHLVMEGLHSAPGDTIPDVYSRVLVSSKLREARVRARLVEYASREADVLREVVSFAQEAKAKEESSDGPRDTSDWAVVSRLSGELAFARMWLAEMEASSEALVREMEEPTLRTLAEFLQRHGTSFEADLRRPAFGHELASSAMALASSTIPASFADIAAPRPSTDKDRVSQLELLGRSVSRLAAEVRKRDLDLGRCKNDLAKARAASSSAASRASSSSNNNGGGEASKSLRVLQRRVDELFEEKCLLETVNAALSERLGEASHARDGDESGLNDVSVAGIIAANIELEREITKMQSKADVNNSTIVERTRALSSAGGGGGGSNKSSGASVGRSAPASASISPVAAMSPVSSPRRAAADAQALVEAERRAEAARAEASSASKEVLRLREVNANLMSAKETLSARVADLQASLQAGPHYRLGEELCHVHSECERLRALLDAEQRVSAGLMAALSEERPSDELEYLRDKCRALEEALMKGAATHARDKSSTLEPPGSLGPSLATTATSVILSDSSYSSEREEGDKGKDNESKVNEIETKDNKLVVSLREEVERLEARAGAAEEAVEMLRARLREAEENLRAAVHEDLSGLVLTPMKKSRGQDEAEEAEAEAEEEGEQRAKAHSNSLEAELADLRKAFDSYLNSDMSMTAILENQVEAMRRRFASELLASFAGASSKEADLIAECAKKDGALRALRAELARAKEVKDSRRGGARGDAAASATSSRVYAAAAAQKEIQVLRHEKGMLEADAARLVAEASEQAQTLEQARRRVRALEEDGRLAMRHLEQERARNERLEAELARVSALAATAQDAEQALRAQKDEVARKSKLLRDLRSELDDKRRLVDSLQRSLLDSEERLKRAVRDASRKDTLARELKSRYEDVTTAAASAASRGQDENEELVRARADLARKDAALRELRARTAGATEREAELEAENARLSESLKRSKAESERRKKALEVAEAQAASASSGARPRQHLQPRAVQPSANATTRIYGGGGGGGGGGGNSSTTLVTSVKSLTKYLLAEINEMNRKLGVATVEHAESMVSSDPIEVLSSRSLTDLSDLDLGALVGHMHPGEAASVLGHIDESIRRDEPVDPLLMQLVDDVVRLSRAVAAMEATNQGHTPMRFIN
jgi:hypothetical protein